MATDTGTGAGMGMDTGRDAGVDARVRPVDPARREEGGGARVVRSGGPLWLPAGRSLGLAAVHGVLAYALAWVVAALLILLAVLSMALLAPGGDPDSVQGALTETLQAGQSDGGFQALVGTLLFLPTQVLGMAFLSPLEFLVGFRVLDLPLSLSGRVTFVPLAVTLVAAYIAAVAGFRSERIRRQSWGGRAVLAVCSGAAAAVVALILTASTAVDVEDGASRFSVSSVSPALVLGAVVVVGGGALVGATAAGRRHQDAPASAGPVRYLGAALRVVGIHYLVVTVLAGTALLIAAGVEIGPAVLLSAPAWLPTATALTYGAVNLAPVEAVFGADAESFTVFDLPWWGWLASLVVLLLATLAAALAWSARTRFLDRVQPAVAWTALPATFLGCGLVVTGVARVTGSASGVRGVTTAAYGPGPWTWCVLAGWGLAITLLARFAAPPVLAVWPSLARVPLLRPTAGPPAGDEAGVSGTTDVSSTTDVPAAPSSAGASATRVVPVPRGHGHEADGERSGAPIDEGQPRTAGAWRVKAVVGGGASVLLLLIAGVVTVNMVNQSAFGPDKAVEAYLDALVAGDAEESRSLIGSGIGDVEATLLSNSVYGAAVGRPSGYEVRDVSLDGDTATITADLRQGNVTTGVNFTATRTGFTGIFFDEWRLDGPEPLREITMVLPRDLQFVTVNGAEVALPPGDAGLYAGLRAVFLPALPGEYVVEPPAPSRYLSYGDEQTISVSADPAAVPGEVLFEAAPTPAVKADAVATVNDSLAACIASTDYSPSACPNRSFMFGDPEDVRNPSWTLDQEPTFTLGESYDPGVYRLSSDDARATFSYERNAEFDSRRPPRWVREQDTQTLYINALVTVTGETIEVDLD